MDLWDDLDVLTSGPTALPKSKDSQPRKSLRLSSASSEFTDDLKPKVMIPRKRGCPANVNTKVCINNKLFVIVHL